MTQIEMEIRPDRTAGAGHDEFWTWCTRGELRLQKCKTCAHIQWPVSALCEECGGSELPFEPLSGRGKVISWATFERDYYEGLLPIPWDTILVELEEGPLFISNPQSFSWRDVIPDMPVKVTFISVADSNGPFSLPVFQRIERD